MSISELAGLPADPSSLVDVEKLVGAYYELRPDPSVPGQRVAFGTCSRPPGSSAGPMLRRYRTSRAGLVEIGRAERTQDGRALDRSRPSPPQARIT